MINDQLDKDDKAFIGASITIGLVIGPIKDQDVAGVAVRDWSESADAGSPNKELVWRYLLPGDVGTGLRPSISRGV